MFLIRRLKSKRLETFLMPSVRAFQSSTYMLHADPMSHERFDCGLQMLLLKRVL